MDKDYTSWTPRRGPNADRYVRLIEVRLKVVYSLWNHPTLLKTVATWDHVHEKLQGGADLMTPGLTRWSSEIKAGDVVAVTSQTNIPMAVGVAGFDIGQLLKAVGEKGKAVYLVHSYHDDLWSLGSKTKPPASFTPTVDLPVEAAIERLSLDAKEDDVATSDTAPEISEEIPSDKEAPDTELSIPGSPSASVLTLRD
jgi:translation initiation factor 2D